MTMHYTIIESKVWKHKLTGRQVSIYGAAPWNHPSDQANWEMVTRGWTVRNPYTNEIGICRQPWATREEAEQWATANRPSTTLMYD